MLRSSVLVNPSPWWYTNYDFSGLLPICPDEFMTGDGNQTSTSSNKRHIFS